MPSGPKKTVRILVARVEHRYIHPVSLINSRKTKLQPLAWFLEHPK